MNEPIISPLFFYIIDISENVRQLSIFALAASLICLSVSPLLAIELSKKSTRIFIICVALIGAFAAIAACFTPSKSGLISMLVASEITHERVDFALSNGSQIKESIKADIMEIFEAINRNDSDE